MEQIPREKHEPSWTFDDLFGHAPLKPDLAVRVIDRTPWWKAAWRWLASWL